MTDSDVEMLSEDFARMSATTYTTIDWAFHEIAENDDEYRILHDRVHTCFCRLEYCVSCAVRDCEHHDPYHYHHDGCPSCAPRAEPRPERTIMVEFSVDGVRFALPVYD